MTSLMEGASVRSITTLSIPIPSPAVGGRPYSKATRGHEEVLVHELGLIIP
jgi:hypothetical protein